MIGLDVKQNVVAECEALARRLDAEGSASRAATSRAANLDAADLVVTLHACDTATDAAIAPRRRARGEGHPRGAVLPARADGAARECVARAAAPLWRAPRAVRRRGDGCRPRASALELVGYDVQVVELCRSSTRRRTSSCARHGRAGPDGPARLAAEYRAFADALAIEPALEAAPVGRRGDPGVSCSELSLAAAVPLAGTTTRAERWLLVEHGGPWEGTPCPTPRSPKPWPKRCSPSTAACPHAPPRARGGLGVRPRSPRAPRRTEESFGGSTSPAWRTSRTPTSTRPASPSRARSSSSAPTDRRDACCARLGVPVYNALRAHLPAELLWRSSHQGGHRFAANVLALPHGIQLGRVGPTEAAEVAAALATGRIPLAHYRGRSLHAPEVQAADALVRTVEGLDRVGDVRLVEHEGDRVVLATPRAVLEVRVEERPGPALPASCGAEPELTTSLTAAVVGRRSRSPSR